MPYILQCSSYICGFNLTKILYVFEAYLNEINVVPAPAVICLYKPLHSDVYSYSLQASLHSYNTQQGAGNDETRNHFYAACHRA